MQAWRRQSNVCVFCAWEISTRSSRPIAGARRLFSSTPQFSRAPAPDGKRERGGGRAGSKGKWSRRATVTLKRDLLNKDPEILAKVVKANFSQIKSRLKTKMFGADGVLRQCSILDPDLRTLNSFQKRVYAAFDGETDLGDERPLEPAAIHACTEAFVNGQNTSLRQALADAYVHHIMVDKGYGHVKEHQNLFEGMHYPAEFYPYARTMQREIHLHVGPTNSGKTYTALKRLEGAESGFYAGPLRLLAHEVYSRFISKGVACGLVTGDEVRDMETMPRLSCHTVEMVPLHRTFEVGVIDEIQMIGDRDRGWAWTQALLGSQAKELHLCGEERAVPLVREIAASLGDTLHVHEYQRLNPLKPMSRSLRGDLGNLRKGDCVVCFSILNIHAMKKDIERATGRNCAVVYGSLPPEIRAQQARLFNDPDNSYDYLVASDAIGMGLNLGIKRIIFESVHKFNGTHVELLSVPSLKQIAGRAGRYMTSHQAMTSSKGAEKTSQSAPPTSRNIGLVTSMQEEDLPYLHRAMQQVPAPITLAGLQVPSGAVAQFAAAYPHATPYTYILNRIHDMIVAKGQQSRYFLCASRETQNIARTIEGIDGLTAHDKWTFTASPASLKDGSSKEILRELARCVGKQKKGNLLDLGTIPLELLERPIQGTKEELQELELLHKSLTLYIWLSFRFGDIFQSRVLAEHAKGMVEQKMDQILSKLSVDPDVRQQMSRRASQRRLRLAKESNEILDNMSTSEETTKKTPVVPMQDWQNADVSARTVATTV